MRYLKVLLGTTLAAAMLYLSLALALALSSAPIPAEYWVREMIVIKRSIAKQYAGQHKIIIAGGSSTLFSIDTRQLGGELKMPVINFGLHAALPLKTILDEAAGAAEKGDTVILALEPPFYCINEPTAWQVRNAIAWDHEQWATWSVLQQVKALGILGDPDMFLDLAQAGLDQKFRPETVAARLAARSDEAVLAKFASAPEPEKFAYSAYNLDALGNMKRIEGAEYAGIPRPADEKIAVCAASWQLLSAFSANMESRAVRVYFVNTPYVATSQLNRAKVDAASAQFAGQMSRLAPVLDSKSELVFERRLFFNSDLHMNEEGRRLRTKMLAESLHKYLADLKKQH